MKRKRTMIITLGAILLVLLAACSTDPAEDQPQANDGGNAGQNAEPTPPPEPTDEPEPAAAPGYEQAQKYAGVWVGEWRNTTFGSTGEIQVQTSAEDDGTASMTVDVGGMVFGLIDPDPQTYTGTYDADGATFEIIDDPVFGKVSVTILWSGETSMTAELIPDPGIAEMTAAGTFTDTEYTGEYSITFAGGGGAEGAVTLTRSQDEEIDY